MTVRAEDIVGVPGMPPPSEPTPPPNRRRVAPLVIAGAVVVTAGAAAGAVAVSGVFSSTGTVASTTITSSPTGLVGTTTGPTTAPTPTTSSDSPTPSDSSSDTTTPSPTDTSTSTPTPTPTPPPPPPPTSVVGRVQLDPALVPDARAVQVATLFDSYFSAVSSHDFDAALALYDPAGDVNTNDSQQRASFKKSEATSTDDNGVLKTLSPDGPGPVTTAKITFRSQQAAGYGPSDTPNQTCSIWTLTYTLSYSDGKYLIKSATGSHTGC